MSNTKVPGRDTLPKTGRVNEVCQEWMVREDSALAYRLQNQEFVEHLSGNKVRNQLVREDYPKAKDEQVREQLMAEQAAAIYHKMLAEQEEIDKRVAKELAEKLEREERMKRRILEVRDQDVVRQMLEKERSKVEKVHHMPPQYFSSSQKQPILPPKNEVQMPQHRPSAFNYQVNLPRRQAAAMPLPNEQHEAYIEPIGRQTEETDSAELYNEPYKTSRQLSEQFNKIEIAEVGLPLDEFTDKQLQEQKDAELARQLQEQEGSLEDTLLNRDRMLAIEAQDKELAKLLQERERAKAKRAREKAKQKALAKKQQQAEQERNMNQILPDDSYALPADMITSHVPRNIASYPDMYAVPNAEEEDISYSLPADVLPSTSNKNSLKMNTSPGKLEHNGEFKELNIGAGYSSMEGGSCATTPPIRPSYLDLRSPLTRPNKPRFPDPEQCDTSPPGSAHSGTSPSQLTNIAMAIDPTYNRRNYRPSSSYDTTSSTVTTSTSSSSPGMLLLPADAGEQGEDSVAPPYMPIQGQRRTASLEKKKKRDGCKQQ